MHIHKLMKNQLREIASDWHDAGLTKKPKRLWDKFLDIEIGEDAQLFIWMVVLMLLTLFWGMTGMATLSP